MSITLALGHYLELTSSSGQVHRFQNFSIGESKSYKSQTYYFLPFGFSGVTVSRQGDNVDADIVLPNNELSRPWAVEAIRDRWVAQLDTVLLDPDGNDPQLLHPYVGQVAAGGWDTTALTLRLNTVLDAVGADFPHRTVNEHQCGPLPVTANVRV